MFSQKIQRLSFMFSQKIQGLSLMFSQKIRGLSFMTYKTLLLAYRISHCSYAWIVNNLLNVSGLKFLSLSVISTKVSYIKQHHYEKLMRFCKIFGNLKLCWKNMTVFHLECYITSEVPIHIVRGIMKILLAMIFIFGRERVKGILFQCIQCTSYSGATIY